MSTTEEQNSIEEAPVKKNGFSTTLMVVSIVLVLVWFGAGLASRSCEFQCAYRAEIATLLVIVVAAFMASILGFCGLLGSFMTKDPDAEPSRMTWFLVAFGGGFVFFVAGVAVILLFIASSNAQRQSELEASHPANSTEAVVVSSHV